MWWSWVKALPVDGVMWQDDAGAFIAYWSDTNEYVATLTVVNVGECAISTGEWLRFSAPPRWLDWMRAEARALWRRFCGKGVRKNVRDAIFGAGRRGSGASQAIAKGSK